MNMYMFVKYLTYIVKHKYFVYQACRFFKVGVWQALCHDLSKFRYQEFVPYAKWFYNQVKANEAVKELFRMDMHYAWNYHQKHNRHHWQYWLLVNSAFDMTPLKIPDRYVKEMVADWVGAGMSINGTNDVASWYKANRDQMLLHPDSRIMVEKFIADYDSARSQNDFRF